MKQIIVFLLLSTSCVAWSQSRESKKKAREERDIKAYEALLKMVEGQQITFTADFAYPHGGGSVPLYSIDYTLIIKTFDLSVYLPYFGVSRLAPSLLDTDRGIKHDTKLSAYELKEFPEKKEVLLSFKSKPKGQESYQYRLRLGIKNQARLIVISTHRDPISYNGDWSTGID